MFANDEMASYIYIIVQNIIKSRQVLRWVPSKSMVNSLAFQGLCMIFCFLFWLLSYRRLAIIWTTFTLPTAIHNNSEQHYKCGILCGVHIVKYLLTFAHQDIRGAVRSRAVLALQRLQNPTDPECPVTRAYTFHMSCDPSAAVRR